MLGGRKSQVVRAAAVVGPVAVLLGFAAHQALGDRAYRSTAALALALVWLIGSVLVLRPNVRWLSPGLIPLIVGVASGLVWLSDARLARFFEVPAKGATLAAVVLFGLLALGVDAAGVVQRVVRAVGAGLTIAFGAVAFGIVVLPAWVWTRLWRRNPVRPDRQPHPVWSGVGSAGHEGPRSLGASSGRAPARHTVVGRLAWGVGSVTLLVAGNYASGWAWDRATTDPAPPIEAAIPDRSYDGPTRRDPRNDVPAMAAYPWREEYFETIQRPTGGYWPFTEYRPHDFTSELVNQRGWLRKTYEPAGDLGSMPVAWMFGGSTTWGEGQRDDYTIASHLARISEAEGVPLRVQNYGERGWTHFQEMILFEQQLVSEPTPDLALFYDGANEPTTQSLLEEAVPSHTLASAYAKKLYGTSIATELVQKPHPPDLLGDLRDAYEEHSAAHKLVDLLRGDPAGAAPAQEDGSPSDPVDEGFTAGQADQGDGVSNYDIQEQDGIDAGTVYERGKAFTLMLSEKHDVDTLLFWQPMGYRSRALDAARDQLTPPTIDIADSLEYHPDVFIDGGHTNEEGARLVAEAIWIHLEPRVRAWYAANR